MQEWVSLKGEHISTQLADNFFGVGLIKSESIGLSSGYSPYTKERIEITREYTKGVCECFNNRPVYYRLNCHSSRTMNSLLGNFHYLKETTPFLGMIGARRCLEFQDESKIEFEMLSNLSAGYNNLHVVIPFIHDVSEYVEIRSILKNSGFSGNIGIMLETPASLLSIDSFLKSGCDYYMIGTNDLTSLVLGVARYEPSVSKFFNRSHCSVLKIIQDSLAKIEGSRVTVGATGYLNEVDLVSYKKLNLDFISYYL